MMKKIKKYGGNEIFGLLRDFKFCWIDGRVQGGKTSFAVELAEYYAERGYRIVANIPVAFAENWRDIHLMDDGLARVFMILDEGGMWLPGDAEAKKFKAFLGKLDIIVVLSSVEEPPRSFRKIKLEVMENFMKIGLPIIWYRWSLKRSIKDDTGKILWLQPKNPWGKYSRQYPAISPNGLDKLMARLMEEFIAFHGDDAEITPNEENLAWLQKERDPSAEIMLEAAEIFADAAEEIVRSQRKPKKKKRRFSL